MAKRKKKYYPPKEENLGAATAEEILNDENKEFAVLVEEPKRPTVVTTLVDIREYDDLKAVAAKSVAKAKLAEEPLTQRLNWYYNDLVGWQRFAAHATMLTLITVLGTGVYFVIVKLGDETDFSNYIALIISVITALTGINVQTSAFKLPSEKTKTEE